MNEAQKLTFVVDDDPALRRIICHVVRKAGHEARECASVSEARQMLGDVRPDFVFLDVGLNGASGNEVLDMMAELQMSAPVMLVSGRGQSELEAISQSGADLGLNMLPALMKPFHGADILTALEGALAPSERKYDA